MSPLPHQSYLVAATLRSGSTMLCDLLTDTRVAGCPAEHFAEGFDYEAALRAGTSGNGVFGTKVMWHRFPALVGALRTLPQFRGRHAADALEAAFPGLAYVQVLREDKVAQAVSLWASEHEEYDFDGVERLRGQLTLQERAWTNWFKAIGVRPVVVVYEELLRSPRRTAHQVLARLDLEPADVAVPRLPRNPAVHRVEWAAQHRAAARAREAA